jgi:hypothetical protein
VTGGWRIIHSEEPYNLYSTKYYEDYQAEGEIERPCSMHSRNAYRIMIRRPQKNSCRHRLEDDIEMGIKEMGCDVANSPGSR